MLNIFKKKINRIEDDKVIGLGKIALDRFKKNKIAMTGLIMFSIIVLSVILIPLVSRYELSDFNLEDKHLAPSSEHFLGTDNQGRDMLYRVFLGGRISIQIGVIVVVITIVMGTLIGSISGYYGGKVDSFLMRFTEIFYTIPYLPTLIALAALLMWVDAKLKIYTTMAIIGFLSWPGLARLVRGQILSLREEEFMQATHILGISTSSKIIRHILPNVLAYIIISAAMGMASAILTEAGLSFLGLGVAAPYPSWGNLIQAARNTKTLAEHPWMWIPPGMMILLTVVSVNLLGEGLRDALDPKEVR